MQSLIELSPSILTSGLIAWKDYALTMVIVDEMVSWLHYPPFPNKKVVNKSVDDNIDTFWKEFKHFYRTGPYSYCSSSFENDDALLS